MTRTETAIGGAAYLEARVAGGAMSQAEAVRFARAGTLLGAGAGSSA
jgi:hypothetical protein